MHSRVLRFDGLALKVVCSRRGDLLWLVEFLTPQFSRHGQDRADWTVILRTASGTYATLADRFKATPPSDRVAAFALDTRTVYLPRSRPTRHRQILFDGDFQVVYRIDAKAREIVIIRPSYNRWNARVALMRVVREIAMNDAESRGGVLIHGAAFLMSRRRAVVLAGPKNAGKTTSLLQALAHGRVRYISNDRVLLTERSQRVACRGIPTIVTVRSSTLAHRPSFDREMATSRYVCYLTRREADERRGVKTAARDAEGRFSLSPSQLCDLTGTIAVAGGPVAALVFPVITDRKGSARVRRIFGKAAMRRVRSGLFRAGRPKVTEPAFAAAAVVARRVISDLTAALPARIPCFELELGLEAASDPSWIQHLSTLLDRNSRASSKV